MPRYAAIDIGSNSVRMLAADAAPDGSLQTLAADREVTRLGESVFRAGSISRQAIDFVSSVLARMAQTYKKLDVSGVRAVATAAVRDASNQSEFIARASEAVGSPVEIISGQEEARLIHLGVQNRWPHPKEKILIVDVGGGSAEIIYSERGRLQEAFSRPLGAVRLTGVFLRSDPPKPVELDQMREFIEEKLAPALRKLQGIRVDRAIATSATAAAMICAVNRVPRARREEADRLRATERQVRKLYKDLAEKDLSRRARVVGIGPRRAQIIIPGVAVLLECLDRFRLPALHYSTAGVRDGIIADLAARKVRSEVDHLSREQRQVVEKAAMRYGVSLKHSRQVALFCRILFESFTGLHKLSPYWGKLLEAAAILYDIGHFISDTGHHKHAEYIVANLDLPGFTDRERLLIATLCRFHRKSMPGIRHTAFNALNPDDRKALLYLIPLLRIADSLDLSKAQRVGEMACTFQNGAVQLQIRGTGRIDLELWAGQRAGEVFEQIYNVPIAIARSRR